MELDYQDNVLSLKGDITAATLQASEVTAFVDALTDFNVNAIAFAGSHYDSAALALLLEGFKTLDPEQLPSLINPPESLRDLAALYEVSHWITS